ncbi:hypothetical protein PsorP6_017126 [Peronosclerospora sorghi]|uniref:Uncharacterized protein n=1 Tax=Peronosclerospora sorghi TaxID=230839 RepID=A0ACC0WEQ8_9STRA|nr:hypothetical protein PsorP6_017126 [Peronosclerospora sorghi]
MSVQGNWFLSIDGVKRVRTEILHWDEALKSKFRFFCFVSRTVRFCPSRYDSECDNIEYYQDTWILLMGIENIHTMLDSTRKLFDLIKHEVRGNERPNWLSCFENEWSVPTVLISCWKWSENPSSQPTWSLSTRWWLEHVRSILVSCSICVAQLVEGTSFLIHCSDGWDRTAQITALVKLCADPFYRTRKGFQVLIEQEWCAFGHQFRVRSGRPGSQAGYWEDESTSPVFLQFIDAVWQLMRQFPCSFEFSERFLIALVDEVYCKQSGTFGDDCEERRMRSKTFLRCHSAWTVLESHRDAADFHNPFYVVPRNAAGPSDKAPTVLECKWHTSSVAIWSSFYLRSLESNESRDAWAKEVQVTQRELQHELSAAQHELRSQVEQNSDLQSEVEQLKRERAQLHRLLEGEVYSDTLNGLSVHEEEDENEDGVLLSVTPMGSTSRSLLEGAEDCSMTLTGGVGCFLGAAMSQDFETVHTYFDPSRQEAKRMKTPTTCHDLFPSRQRVSMEEVVR